MDHLVKLTRAAAAGRAAITNAGSLPAQDALLLLADALVAVVRVVEDVRDDIEATEVAVPFGGDGETGRRSGW